MRRPILARRLIGALALVVSASAALAQPAPNDAARAEAREHFDRGRSHFELGHFDEAIAEFERAYELTREPVFLLNLAQAHRLGGDHDRAIFLYRQYLATRPDAPNREEIEHWIQELEEQRAAQPPATAESPSPETGPAIVAKPEQTVKPALTSRQAPPPTPRRRRLRIGTAFGITTARFGAGAEEPASHWSMLVNVGYQVYRRDLAVDVGVLLTSTQVTYDIDASTSNATLLSSLLFNAGLRYPAANTVDLGLELGAGLLTWSELGAQNPWTAGGQRHPALGFWHTRVALGVEYRVTELLVLSLSPFGIGYSGLSGMLRGERSDLDSSVKGIVRFEFAHVGALFKL